MSFQATTRIRLTEKGAVDEYGEETGDVEPDPASKDYRASIIEKTRVVLDPTSGERRTVRYAVGRVDPSCPVTDQSTIHTREGKVYVVDEVTPTPRSISGSSDVLLTLRVTTGE